MSAAKFFPMALVAVLFAFPLTVMSATPGAVEVDSYSVTTAVLVLSGGTLGSKPAPFILTGPAQVEVFFEGPFEGDAVDDDGNGLDEVATHLAALNLTGGGFSLTLNPAQPSSGQIEEQVNNTARWLDLDPFAPGDADSFFDVFFQIDLGGGLLLHNNKPVRLQAVISKKPGADRYLQAVPVGPIELVDANGRPSGVFLTRSELFTGSVEVDVFSSATQVIDLIDPAGGTEQVHLTGVRQELVFFEGNMGDADDDDGNGRDEVQTEIVVLDLTGNSSLGPVTLSLNPAQPSSGQIEEQLNNIPGTLDLNPFAPGTADSFFDIFVELDVGGMQLHNDAAKHLVGVLHNKPAGPGDSYDGPGMTPLLDMNGGSTGFALAGIRDIPVQVVEVDIYSPMTMEIELIPAQGPSEVVQLSGARQEHVFFEGSAEGVAFDDDGDGLDEVATEMVALSLNGTSSFGPVTLTLNPAFPSDGRIEEQVNNTSGTLDLPPFAATGSADSFFDIFVEITINGVTFHNAVAKHLQGVLHSKPAAPGDGYDGPGVIPLLEGGKPSGLSLGMTRIVPNRAVEVDVFSLALMQTRIILPDGSAELVNLKGPMEEHVFFEGSEGVAYDDDHNGRDEVNAEIVSLSLTGTSSLGPVTMTLNPGFPSNGQIEEQVNNTSGTLDLPPFAITGTADSFFDIFVEIAINGVTFHNAVAKHLQGVLHQKPAAPGDSYDDPGIVPLLDLQGLPSGFFLGPIHHVPDPDNCPGIPNPAQTDTDGDGVGDACDNCMNIPNPGQCNTDGDAYGNLCDCDFNNDGFCGGPDFTLFIGCFNQAVGTDPTCMAADMTCDGFVGGPDFTRFIGGFNAPPGP